MSYSGTLLHPYARIIRTTLGEHISRATQRVSINQTIICFYNSDNSTHDVLKKPLIIAIETTAPANNAIRPVFYSHIGEACISEPFLYSFNILRYVVSRNIETRSEEHTSELQSPDHL